MRVGIFYDGNFFYQASNFYKYAHARRARISISGFHRFLLDRVARHEGADPARCRIVAAHFFRGRFSAADAEAKQALYPDRVFEDFLMSEGVQTHFLPVRGKAEKGIDVLLALEAYDVVRSGALDVLVLITGDGDFIPLVRKSAAAGVRVAVLDWTFTGVDETGRDRPTVTSVHLMDMASYVIDMQGEVPAEAHCEDPLVEGLFVPRAEHVVAAEDGASVTDEASEPATSSPDTRLTGEVCLLRDGFGFLRHPDFPANIYFAYGRLRGLAPADLRLGARVTFLVERNARGAAATDVALAEEGAAAAESEEMPPPVE